MLNIGRTQASGNEKFIYLNKKPWSVCIYQTTIRKLPEDIQILVNRLQLVFFLKGLRNTV